MIKVKYYGGPRQLQEARLVHAMVLWCRLGVRLEEDRAVLDDVRGRGAVGLYEDGRLAAAGFTGAYAWLEAGGHLPGPARIQATTKTKARSEPAPPPPAPPPAEPPGMPQGDF